MCPPWETRRLADRLAYFSISPADSTCGCCSCDALAAHAYAMDGVFVLLGTINALLLAACVRAGGARRAPAAIAAVVSASCRRMSPTLARHPARSLTCWFCCSPCSARALSADGVTRARSIACALALLVVVALLAKESAIVLPALWLIVAIGRGGLRRAITIVAPAALLAAACLVVPRRAPPTPPSTTQSAASAGDDQPQRRQDDRRFLRQQRHHDQQRQRARDRSCTRDTIGAQRARAEQGEQQNQQVSERAGPAVSVGDIRRQHECDRGDRCGCAPCTAGAHACCQQQGVDRSEQNKDPMHRIGVRGQRVREQQPQVEGQRAILKSTPVGPRKPRQVSHGGHIGAGPPLQFVEAQIAGIDDQRQLQQQQRCRQDKQGNARAQYLSRRCRNGHRHANGWVEPAQVIAKNSGSASAALWISAL